MTKKNKQTNITKQKTDEATKTTEEQTAASHEKIYVGNLYHPQTSDMFRWALFLSTSKQAIIPPKTVDKVTFLCLRAIFFFF